jgi:hypothetical protein
MKNAVIISFIFSFSIIGCSEQESASSDIDSVDQKPITTIITDSGTLFISTLSGSKADKAELKDASGKLISSGLFLDGKPAGAWKHFDASGKLLDVKHYSEGRILRELDVNDFDFRTYQNQAMGLQINIPKMWDEEVSLNSDLMVSFRKIAVDTTATQPPAVNIAKAQLGANETLEKLAAMQLKMLHEGVYRLEIIEESYFDADSCRGFKRYGMFTSGKQNIGFLNAIIVSNNTAWMFSCVANNGGKAEFLSYQSVFDEIINSFKRIK